MKLSHTACVFALAIVSSVSFLKAEAPLPLVPTETVVAIQGPAERNVAELLQFWLRKASQTGEGFAIVDAKNVDPKSGARIVLNPPTFELPGDLSEDGFVIRRTGNEIVIKGVAGDATLFGAVEFLRQLGVIFYLPGELFTTLPKDPSLKVGALDIVSTPFVRSLFFSGISIPEHAQWLRLNAANRRKGGTHQHNSFAIFPPERFAERYPELYPIIDGKRHIPVNAKDQAWQPNFIEPVAVDAALESIEDYFKTNPNQQYVAVSIQDGYGFDQGPKTTAVIDRYKASGVDHPIDRATSEIYWTFLSKLGERLKEKAPGKLLVALAYGGTRFPPKFELPDNVVVFTNFHIAEYGYYEKLRDQGPDNGPDAWLKVAKHYGNHDWYHGSGYLMPRSYSGYWSKYLRQIAERLPDAFMHVETYPNWGFDGHKLYILSRLMWDPTQDPSELTQKLSDDLFGPAGPAMKNYFDLLEKLWVQLNVTEGPERKLFSWTRAFATTPESRALIADARKNLNEALAKASTPEEKARVELFSDCFSVGEILFGFAAAETVTSEELDQALAKTQAVLDKHGAMMVIHPNNVIPAVKELASFIRRSGAPAFHPQLIAPRDRLIPIDDPIWLTVSAEKFTMPTGEEDAQRTTIQIVEDGANIYALVRSPLLRERKLLLDEGSTWRSDNIEFKFDIDQNWAAIEGQFWVKPSGRQVDWIEREDKKDSLISSEVARTDSEYVVSVRIPYAYLKQTPGQPGPVGMQVFRNEFKEIPGMNQTDYVSIWAGKLHLSKK